MHTDEHYEGLADSALLLFEGEDWAEEGVQERVLKMLDELDEYDDITTDFSAWLRDYDHYVSTREALIEAKLDNGTAPRRHGDGFFRDLGKWLEKEEPQCSNDNCTRFVVPRAYTKDIVWRGEGDDRRIFATRFRGGIRTPDTLQGRVDTMRAFRRKVEAERDGLRVTPWAYYFMFSDRDAIISTLIFETLGFAAAAVLGSLLFFLHVLTVGVIAAGIACVDGGLFVVMWVWDVPLDVSAFICLAISIGLAVDYVVHVAHAFEHSPGTPPERAQAALVEIGGAVFKGGMSTFLGIVLLAASSAEVFRIFVRAHARAAGRPSGGARRAGVRSGWVWRPSAEASAHVPIAPLSLTSPLLPPPCAHRTADAHLCARHSSRCSSPLCSWRSSSAWRSSPRSQA